MLKQATLGDVDFITGDYLAEVNIANNAEAYIEGRHPGYENSAWEGLKESINVIAQKQIKVVINGGALNPAGLAARVNELVHEKGYSLRVAYLFGDDIRSQVGPSLPSDVGSIWPHLDSLNPAIRVGADVKALIESQDSAIPIVSANVYLGARAWYWHSWSAMDCDELAGSLIAGHLIECSAYVTGANFAGFTNYNQGALIDPGFPIAEIDNDGSCVISKHPGTGGFINEDTVKCQLLYELQGNVYLNSDCKAILDDVNVTQVGDDRVRVTGIRGSPPPSTTKAAIFYKGGYMGELLLNACGYALREKCDLVERQILSRLSSHNIERLDVLEFQRIGTPASNPRTQNSDTMYLRVLFAARKEDDALAVPRAFGKISLKHFSGYHSSLDTRTSVPRPFLTYFPALWEQTLLTEKVHVLKTDGSEEITIDTGHPPQFDDLTIRESYDTSSPIALSGATLTVRLGDVVLARSGDKGSNLNIGLCVDSAAKWDWLRSYLSIAKMRDLVGDDWRDDFFIERVEFTHIFAVHFVIYGILGRGVSSSTRLDGFGKGFADYIRDKMVDVPEELIVCLKPLQEGKGALEMHRYHVPIPTHKLEMNEHEDAQDHKLGSLGDGSLHTVVETLNSQIVLLSRVLHCTAGLSGAPEPAARVIVEAQGTDGERCMMNGRLRVGNLKDSALPCRIVEEEGKFLPRHELVIA
ncbi:duf1446 domain-containing protein [Seiridium cupressi]